MNAVVKGRYRGKGGRRVLTLMALVTSSVAIAQPALSEVRDPGTVLAEFYAERDQLIWTESTGLSAVGEVALRWLRDARHHGLEDLQASVNSIDERLSLLTRDGGHATPSAVAELLTLEGLGGEHEDVQATLERDIALGLSEVAARLLHRPREAPLLMDETERYAPPDVLWETAPETLTLQEFVTLFSHAVASPESLEDWLKERLPQPGQYTRLLEASRHYAMLCDAGGWSPVPVTRYRRGARWRNEEAITALQERLLIEGFYDEAPTGIYDKATKAAVRRYQAARQIRATGTYDPETSKDLNIPCETRLASLHLNLYRWRHTARTDHPDFVEVNLAAQEVRVVFQGEEQMRKRTVVGSGKWFWSRKEKRRIYPKKSPLLTDAIRKIIVNPSWTIPGSIVKQEIRPRVEKDPTYLERKGYIIKKSGSGHDIYVQPPGPDNTLGEVKFIFPNSESIYLHDTNNRYGFRSARRDMSHGCIRVQDALDFATVLLMEDYRRRDKSFAKRTLHRLSRKDKTIVFKLQEPLPVFLEYYTASVDADGIVRFHPDVYDYDLEVALGRPLPRRLP